MNRREILEAATQAVTVDRAATHGDAMAARWADDMALASAMFREAGVVVVNA